MKKILKYFALVAGILIVILLLAPFLFKDQIVSKIKQEANKQLNATINFDKDISLSFFRHFPNASLGVSDLSIVGKSTFDGDTLASINRLDIVIDISSLFGGKTYQIKNVELDAPFIQLLVDSAGKANWDIMKESDTAADEDTSSSSFKAALQKYAIHDGHLIYSDSSINFYLEAKGLDHSGQGDFTQDIFGLQTQSHIKALTLAYGNIPYLKGIKTDLVAGINMNIPESKYSFSKSILKLNGLTIGIDGFIALPDSNNVLMNIAFKAEQADFKNFLSLIPAIYQKNFDDLKASGKLAFNGFVKGIYNDKRIPAFGLQLAIDKGMFQYPSVPEPLSDVNLNLMVQNEDGIIDHTVIDVKQLHFAMGNNPFDAHLTVRNPQSDPLIDGAVKGKLNLSEISKIYPLEKGTTLGGMLDMDVKAKGRMSDIEKENYSRFEAAGQILADNLLYQSSAFDQDLHIPEGKLTFSPRQVEVSNLKARIGKSDITANGGLDNFFSYVFGKQDLKGKLELQSQLLDLNQIMGADTSTTAATATDTSEGVKAVIIPKNINFNLTTNIKHFIYDNYDLKNIRGNVKIADGILTIQNISANMLDGSAQLSGTYNTQNPETPKTDIQFNASNIDIQKAFKTFNTVQALAPVAAFVQGDFSGNISLNTLLNDKLYPQLTSLNSLGNISIPNLNIKGFEPLMKLASTLDIPKLKDLNLSRLLVNFKIDSGFLKVKPFDFSVDDIKMNVAGKNGLNKMIDYTIKMQIPREKLGDANKGLTTLLAKANSAAGTAIDPGEKIDVTVHLGGTITQPKIKLDLSAQKEKTANALKNAARQKLTDLLTSDTTSAKDSTKKAQPIKEKLENTLKKGLNNLFNKSKDTGRK